MSVTRRAGQYVFGFGMWRGHTCQEIGQTERGLAWLRWFKGQRDAKAQRGNAFCNAHEAVTAYLATIPTFAEEYGDMMEQDGDDGFYPRG